MSMSNPYDKYKNNAVFTATKEELTLMLYEGALKFTNQAIVAIENKDYMRAGELIIRVQDIIREFQLTLNRSYEISKNFDTMYTYMHQQLIEANIKKNVTILEEVRDLIREFRDTWKEAMKIARQDPNKTTPAQVKAPSAVAPAPAPLPNSNIAQNPIKKPLPGNAAASYGASRVKPSVNQTGGNYYN